MTIVEKKKERITGTTQGFCLLLIYGISSYIALKLNETSLGFEYYLMRRHKHSLKE